MPKLRTDSTLGYYFDGPVSLKLQKNYGSFLEEMFINDRNCLMLCLSSFIYINDIPIHEGTSLYDCAAAVIQEDMDYTSDEFGNILEILEPITVGQARDLLHALSS
jgi:hypothetical protein